MCSAGHFYRTLPINDCHTALVTSFINSPAPCVSWGTDLHSVQSIADSVALIFKNRTPVIARCVMSSLLRDYADGMATIMIIIIIISMTAIELSLDGRSLYTSKKKTKIQYNQYKTQYKQPQHKIHTKQNSHNTIKYPQYKVTLMYMVLLPPRTSP
jgi:hypothetical protein